MAAIEAVAEEVAINLEEVAEVTRRVNGKNVGLVLGGLLVGAGIGFYFGYRFNREKIRAEAFAQSEDEISKIREVYLQKTVASTPKPSVEEVIEERGYSVAADPKVDERPLAPPVPLSMDDSSGINYRTPTDHGAVTTVPHSPVPPGVWSYPVEMASRTPEAPYVIHQDEFMNSELEYSKVTYTYYAKDDVLVGEDERPLPHADLVVGQDNLKFGYGTDDDNVVFVRNDKLRIEMEICRTPMSYEEEVLGLDNDEAN